MDDNSDLSSDPDQLVTVIDEMEGKITSFQALLAEEAAKREHYKVIASFPGLLSLALLYSRVFTREF